MTLYGTLLQPSLNAALQRLSSVLLIGRLALPRGRPSAGFLIDFRAGELGHLDLALSELRVMIHRILESYPLERARVRDALPPGQAPKHHAQVLDGISRARRHANIGGSGGATLTWYGGSSSKSSSRTCSMKFMNSRGRPGQIRSGIRSRFIAPISAPRSVPLPVKKRAHGRGPRKLSAVHISDCCKDVRLASRKLRTLQGMRVPCHRGERLLHSD